MWFIRVATVTATVSSGDTMIATGFMALVGIGYTVHLSPLPRFVKDTEVDVAARGGTRTARVKESAFADLAAWGTTVLTAFLSMGPTSGAGRVAVSSRPRLLMPLLTTTSTGTATSMENTVVDLTGGVTATLLTASTFMDVMEDRGVES